MNITTKNIIKSCILMLLIIVSNSLKAQSYRLNAPKGYNNYIWYSTSLLTGVTTIVASANSDSLIVSDAGMYYCDFDYKDCRKKSDIVVLLNKCQLKQDTMVTLNAGTTYAGTYQWFKNGSVSLGDISPKKVIFSKDEFDFYAEVYNGSCTIKTEKFIVRAISGGLADISFINLNCKK